MAQILNQFIYRLCSNILQHVHPMHSINLQAAVTNTRDFETAKLEANYAQAINLVMNRSSNLDSKLKQFRNANRFQNQLHPSSSTNQQWQQETHVCHYCAILSKLLIYNAAATLSTTSILSTNSSTDDTSNLLAAVSDNLSASINSNTATELTSKRNPKVEIDPTKLKIVNGSLPTNPQFFHTIKTNQQTTLTSNISSATIIENESLDAIFPFELEELLTTLLFSGAVLEEKSITAMYINVKVNSHFIKLILDIDCAASTRIITADETTKTPIGKIDDFPIEVNGVTKIRRNYE
ncbi:hypothetical protein G9A89_016544 [Geosiphon pyriformis]|nr:hypothetical protein G9A89_016544 [Geosiphon pyriformis]